jgi:hypothetical protein
MLDLHAISNGSIYEIKTIIYWAGKTAGYDAIRINRRLHENADRPLIDLSAAHPCPNLFQDAVSGHYFATAHAM